MFACKHSLIILYFIYVLSLFFYFTPYQSCSLSTLQARLKVAAHQAEEESEETAENFLEGRIDIDEFLNSFMEKRTVRC